MSRHVRHLRWKIVALLVAPLTFVMTLDRTAMAVAAPTIQSELGLSIVEMSMILTIYFWAYALGQMPAGRAAERFGSRSVLFGTSALWSLMMIVTPLGASFAWLFGCRLVLGGAQSADWSSSVVALKPRRRRIHSSPRPKPSTSSPASHPSAPQREVRSSAVCGSCASGSLVSSTSCWC